MKTPRAALLIGLTILVLILAACQQAAVAPVKPGEVPVTDATGRDLGARGGRSRRSRRIHRRRR